MSGKRHQLGWDPFDGESTLPLYFRNDVAAWLRAAADQLGLRDWEIRVSAGTPDEPHEAVAQTFIRDSAPEAVIALANDFLTWPEEARRKTLIHELLHPVVHPLSKYAREAVETELGKRWETLFDYTVAEHEEQIVDRLARGLVPLFPASPDAYES